jgi:GTP pyrophosphokinase
MVKVKDSSHIESDGSIDVNAWLMQLAEKKHYNEINLIRNACLLSQLAGIDMATETGESCLQQGLAMADILADLDVDPETIAAAIVFDSVYYAELNVDDVREQLGDNVAKLVNGITKMSAVHSLRAMSSRTGNKQQIDNIRKMLLAMADDVRVVLIKLAERLRVLRTASKLPESIRTEVAMEVMEIYAPLANRLGIGSIKWEMEDLSFRYLQTERYMEIAKGLKAKRLDRDRYVNLIVSELEQQLEEVGISGFDVYGRSKHIHSIYRKMSRKNVSLAEIYDATAVRVLVNTKDECYIVLGIVHDLWQQIPAEFDDYVSNPKPNGYRSLHTAVVGPENRVFEVQIRTFQMHDEAEMGVAAHWKYKEGGKQDLDSHERKIEWLREVLAWHKELAKTEGIPEDIENEFLDDRVYIFTPAGDVLDLPYGATPLDFAYHVHSEVGHRCRGAKVNGRIVQLTYQLQTGDQVEVLTAKEAKPSRDWINPHLNYLKSSRAKAKVLHWFKSQDYDKNLHEGRDLIDKELKALHINSDGLDEVVRRLNFKKVDDLLAAIGRGDVKVSQVISRLTPAEKNLVDSPKVIKTQKKPAVSSTSDLTIEGVGSLMTSMAKCCNPVPGDEVLGYITLGRGVSIHRKDCPNIIHATEKQKKRFVQVSWGEKTHDHYTVDLAITAYDRVGLLKDLTLLLNNESVNLLSLNTRINKKENIANIDLKLDVESLVRLSRIITKIEQVPNVIEAKRM